MTATVVSTNSKSSMRWVVPAALVGAVAVLAVIAGLMSRSSAATTTSTAPTYAVTRGPLVISVSEPGTIKARQQEIIKSEVEGMATILYLIPEGTVAKKGDLLCELDASKLQDQRVSQEIVVLNAEAAHTAAVENLAVVQSQAKSDIAKAELDYKFAGEDLRKYEKSDYGLQVLEADNKITKLEQQLKQAQQKLEWSETLFKENYIAESQLKSDRLTANSLTLDLKAATMSRDALKEFTYNRQIAQLSSAVEQAAMALERVKRKASADEVQAKATLAAKKAEFERQTALLNKTNDMIKKAKMYAPTDGLVVYATTGGGGGFRSNNEPLAEGQSVRERQDLIYLPTADSVMAEVKVHESSLEKIRLGLPCRVVVDAVPGKVYTGRVAKIAPLPDATSFWQNPDLKVFNTDIHLDGDGTGLRTGMSCRAEIIVDYYPETLYVPVQAVTRVNGKPTVYLPGGDGPEARPVEIGLDNNVNVRILKGLEAGEKVLLNPPLAQASAHDEQPPSMDMPAIPAPTTRPAAGPTSRPSGAPGAGGPGRMGNMSSMTPEQREEMLKNMTPEQRQRMEEMRKRFESMTPEERERMRSQRGQRGEGGGRNPGGAGGPGGPGGGGANQGGPGGN